jgi:signal transduction histidine kinase/ligand-binding sensor domain-containing protein
MAAGMLLVCCSVAFALNPALSVSQYAHTSWKVRDGVFKGSIYAIAQTRDGYLWLGTEFGLVRFDGVRAVAWQPSGDQALAAGPIHALLTARDGTLWIGADTGLASWKAGELTQYPELAGHQVSALLEDRERTVWAGSVGIPTGRLCAIRAGRATCSEEAAVGGGAAGFYEDRKGNLWTGVPNGLWKWKPGEPEFYPVPYEASGVRVLGEDEDGSLLIVQRRRIARFVDGRLEPSSLHDGVPDDFARRLLHDRDGGLWVATLNRGLAHVHGGRTDLFAEGDGLSGDSVRDLFEDREGNIWVATLSGLDRFRDFSIPTWTVKEGLFNPLVWSVLGARDGSIWLGTPLGLGRWHNGEITRFGRDGGLLNGLGPHSLFEDHRGRIWVSTSRDFGYLQNDRFIPIGAVPGGYVLSIAEDTARNIWIVNRQRGLIRLRDDAVQQIPWVALGHSDHAMAAIADPRQGGIWLGFDQGGIAYFSGDRITLAYSAENGLGAGQILDLRFSADGALWAATQGGLSRLKDGSIATLSSQNGLPCDTVHWSLEDDDQALWLYTACGLVRIARSEVDTWTAAVEKDRHTTVAVQLTVFDISDGVRSNLVFHGQKPRMAKTARGTLVFLPIDGVSMVDPRRLPRNELPPPVYVEQITADHATYDAAPGLRLPPRLRDLQIDYTALSLVAPEKNRFRIKLEGRDRDWQDVGTRRQAFYTDLGPGTYRFRVAASNNSGVWNETGATLDFAIAPAFNQTPWFRAVVAAALAALLWAAYRFRMRLFERHSAEITALNDRLMTAQEQERTRIAGELHDSVMQRITALSLVLGTAKRKMPPDSGAKEMVGDVQRQLIDVGVEIRQISHDLHPPALQAAGLPEALRGYCDAFGKARAIPISCDADGSLADLSPGASLALYRVAQEALGNAVKHAAPTRIAVRLARQALDVVLTVTDDGRGCDPERITQGGLGLINMRERARQLGGTFEVDSRPGRGTTVRVAVPFRARRASPSPGAEESG